MARARGALNCVCTQRNQTDAAGCAASVGPRTPELQFAPETFADFISRRRRLKEIDDRVRAGNTPHFPVAETCVVNANCLPIGSTSVENCHGNLAVDLQAAKLGERTITASQHHEVRARRNRRRFFETRLARKWDFARVGERFGPDI